VTSSATESAGWKWSYKVANGEHNHLPSLEPSAHPIHRRRTKQQLDLIHSIAKYKGVPAREMANMIRDREADAEERPCFRMKDIYNDRQRQKEALLEGLSPTQAWIQLLQDEGLRHQVQYDDKGRVKAVFWTYPWCEEMWKTFPEVLGLDNTYKTNRFNMYLFQATGITDQQSVVNFAFGLVGSEGQETYEWLCEALEAFRAEISAAKPNVIVTDKEVALRNALAIEFPEAQQQLCVYHVNANVRGRITSKWKGPANLEAAEGDNSDDDDDDFEPTDADFAAAARAEEDAGNKVQLPPPETRLAFLTPETMFTAWQRVIYAPTEAAFDEAWNAMIDTYGSTQGHTLRYVSRYWFPWRHEWACCLISQYRNFGQRVNMAESAHKQFKTYLLNGTATLLRLHESIVQMLRDKERAYREATAQQDISIINKYRNADWLGDLPLLITRRALLLLWEQGKKARAADPRLPEPTPLEPCSGTWYQQHGLPCKHDILAAIEDRLELQKQQVHPRWWLRKPIDLSAVIYSIRDPAIVEKVRGRPRGARNKKIPIPVHLMPPGMRTPAGESRPSSERPMPQATPRTGSGRRVPSSQPLSSPMLPPSLPSSVPRPSRPSAPSSLRSSNPASVLSPCPLTLPPLATLTLSRLHRVAASTQPVRDMGRRRFAASLRREPSSDELAIISRTKRARTNTQGTSRGMGLAARWEGKQRSEGPVEDCIVVSSER
jgi:hypothetical protein